MSPSSRTSGGVRLRLVLTAIGLTVAASVLAFVVAALALPWDAMRLLGLARLLGTMSVVYVLVSVVAARVVRSALAAPADRLSDRAIRALFAVPLRAALVATLALVAVCTVDALGGGLLSGLGLGDGLAAVSLAFAFQQNAALHLALAWRVSLWRSHLGRLPIDRIPSSDKPQLALRFALRLASAVVLLAGTVLAVPLAYDASASAVPVAAVWLFGLVGALIGGVGERLGHRTGVGDGDKVEEREFRHETYMRVAVSPFKPPRPYGSSLRAERRNDEVVRPARLSANPSIHRW